MAFNTNRKLKRAQRKSKGIIGVFKAYVAGLRKANDALEAVKDGADFVISKAELAKREADEQINENNVVIAKLTEITGE